MSTAQTFNLIPRRQFFDPLERRLVRISPDGAWIAFHAPVDGIFNLWLAQTEDPSTAQPITAFEDRSIGPTLAWTFDGQHVLISRDTDGDENFQILAVDTETCQIMPISPGGGTKAYVQELSTKFPDEVLIAHNERSAQHFDIYRVSLADGVTQLIERNNKFQGFVTDSDFNVRLARRYTDQGEIEYLKKAGERWQPHALVPFEDSLTTWPVDYSDDGNELFWIDSRGRDKSAAITENVATGETRVLAEDAQADIDSLLLHPRTRRPIAAAGAYARVRWSLIDPNFEAMFVDLGKLPGDIFFGGMCDNAQKFVFTHVRDDRPIDFHYYDRSIRSTSKLFSAQPKLEDLPLVTMDPVVVEASDGLDLLCYLTRPECRTMPAPMVLVVHGGPWMRDWWGLNPTHQWLANRGYAVLSVNFRGSTGFGKAFVNFANKEWGGKMQSDLINAVDWAISEGVADPDRIAIMGGSYGGYAALTGLTQTPDKFACAVDLVGISNLLTFLDSIPEYWKTWKSVYRTRLGDFTTPEGRRFLEERSPLSHVDRIKKPLLIVQGENDVRVKASESEQIVSAMRKSGIPVTYVSYPDEGHGVQRMENRRSYHAVVEAFLAQHLGGPCEATGDDLADSSIRFVAGRALISGV